MIKRLLGWPGLVFALVFAWKLLLLILSAQPVNSNDAFFYDGAVVNYLLHGKYVNPAIALALPISGTQVFSAYPPLHQFVLLLWMSVFGTSVVSALFFHLALFGVYSLTVLAILRRLETPLWCIHIAGAFLLVLTFHDRPDSVAHVFGVLAIYFWVRSRAPMGAAPASPNRWEWGMATSIVLTFCASLQIGSVYFLLIWLGTLATTLVARQRFPLAPMLLMSLLPAALVALVVVGFPHLWSGFLEHASQTPSLTGVRPLALVEVLKVIRTAPGLLAIAVLLPWASLKRMPIGRTAELRFWLLAAAATLAGLAVVAGCLTVVTPNIVFVAGYLQPLIVGAYLAFVAPLLSTPRAWRKHLGLFLALVLLGSVRAIGMTTWGLACATDVGYPAALQYVKTELDRASPGEKVALSGAFLYEAARRTNIVWLHSDWLSRAAPNAERKALVGVKPTKLILTQMDYYRRYEPILADLRTRPDQVEFTITNTARIPAPDSFKALQKVVQHISWAPIIVEFSWK